MVTKEKTGVLLSSDRSMEISLESIKNGNAGLNKHRLHLLSKVPASNEWHRFSKDSITIKDIAYLSAKTGHAFALLRGKKEDIFRSSGGSVEKRTFETHCSFTPG